MAHVMLAAQILVILAALLIQPASSFEAWLWQLQNEGNIPSTLASTQLALVGVAALIAARFTQRRRAVHRAFLLGTGLVFLILAIDEFAMIHEFGLGRYFMVLGAALIVGSIAVATRSPSETRSWLVAYVAGLALSAAGAVFLEIVPPICGKLSIVRFDKCLYFFTWEECLEFLGIWLVLVAVLGFCSEANPAPAPRMRCIVYGFPLLWIAFLAVLALAPRLEVRLVAKPVSVNFESGVRLSGYRMDQHEESVNIRLFVSVKRERYEGLGFSIHMIDQTTGDSTVGSNSYGDRRYGFWLFGSEDVPVFVKEKQIPFPPGAPANRAMWIALSLWRERNDRFVRQKIASSDLPLLDDTQVILGELVFPAHSMPATSPPLAKFSNGFALETVDMPEFAQAGEPLDITFAWRADEAGQADTIQFLHLGHEDTGEWFVYDQPPLGPRLPARLWYAGMADSETWQVPLPAGLEPGRYSVFTGLYRASDQERIAAADGEGKPWLDNRVSLGEIIIE